MGAAVTAAYLILAAALGTCVILGRHWRGYCAWWARHDVAGALILLAVVTAAMTALALQSLAWVRGYTVHLTGNPVVDYGHRWWAAKTGGRRLAWQVDANRGYVGAGMCLVAGIGGAALRGPDADDGAAPSRPWFAWLRRKPSPAAGLGAEKITAALTAVGAITAGKDGTPPRITLKGKPQRNAYGESWRFSMPRGATYGEVAKRATELASHLEVPAQRLQVTHSDRDAPNVVTLWVGGELPRIGSGRTAAVARIERTRWGVDPVVVGRTVTGENVAYKVDSIHSALMGATRQGKTVLGRNVLAYGILDPVVPIWAVSGKGERADWDGMARCCRLYIGTVDERMPELFDEMLRQVEAYRAAKAEASLREGRAVPGAILLIEELAKLRAHCKTVLGKEGLEHIDAQVATLLAAASSAGIHIILIAQRPTVTNIPSDQSANVGQRVVFKTTKPSEVTLALGGKPEVPAPTRKGQCIILDDEHGERFVLVDYLTDDQWLGICARGEALRGVDDDVIEDDGAPVEDDEPDVDPLLALVVTALEVAEGEALTPVQLFEALPEADRPTTAMVLGKRLAARGLKSEMVDKRRVYTFQAAREAAGTSVV
jgi:hypothetical protein